MVLVVLVVVVVVTNILDENERSIAWEICWAVDCQNQPVSTSTTTTTPIAIFYPRRNIGHIWTSLTSFRDLEVKITGYMYTTRVATLTN